MLFSRAKGFILHKTRNSLRDICMCACHMEASLWCCCENMTAPVCRSTFQTAVYSLHRNVPLHRPKAVTAWLRGRCAIPLAVH